MLFRFRVFVIVLYIVHFINQGILIALHSGPLVVGIVRRFQVDSSWNHLAFHLDLVCSLFDPVIGHAVFVKQISQTHGSAYFMPVGS